jgi:glycosyltransferase involved in cell wall biosynthesis
MMGGVADYTWCVAHALAKDDDVHVWCPTLASAGRAEALRRRNPHVHPECGAFAAADLERVGALLDRFEAPRRLIVQWVPHGYGMRAMNVGFCAWLWKRARRGDDVELMVHEPYLAFREGSWRQDGAAAVQRLMTVMLLRAAKKVWVAIPAWQALWRPYALGRPVPFEWLPVPSSLPTPAADTIAAERRRLGTGPLAGHLGTYGSLVTDLLAPVIEEVLTGVAAARMVLIGTGSDRFAAEFARRAPGLASRVIATGSLRSDELSPCIAACDVLLQPYPDGVSSRRTSVMAGMKLGVPTVTTRGRLTEGLWESAHAVRLAEVGDTAGFAAHAIALLNRPEDRSPLIRAARHLYQHHFDVDHVVGALKTA